LRANDNPPCDLLNSKENFLLITLFYLRKSVEIARSYNVKNLSALLLKSLYLSADFFNDFVCQRKLRITLTPSIPNIAIIEPISEKTTSST